MKYQNKYGSVEFELFSEYIEISELDSSKFDQEVFKDMEITEKIALITESPNDLQFSFRLPLSNQEGYIVHHNANNKRLVALLKVVNITFESPNGKTPTEQIEIDNKTNTHWRCENILKAEKLR